MAFPHCLSSNLHHPKKQDMLAAHGHTSAQWAGHSFGCVVIGWAWDLNRTQRGWMFISGIYTIDLCVNSIRNLLISMIVQVYILIFPENTTTNAELPNHLLVFGHWNPSLPMRLWRCHPHPCDMQPWWNLHSFWSSNRRHWPRVLGVDWAQKGLKIGRIHSRVTKKKQVVKWADLWSWIMVTIMIFMQVDQWIRGFQQEIK